MSAPATPIGDAYNPLSPQHQADPYAIYKRARAEQPIFYSENILKDTGVWVVTRYEDVLHVHTHPDIFLSKDALRPLVPIHPQTRALLAAGYPLVPTYVETDGPSHRRTSVPLKQIFSSEGAQRMRPFIRQTVDRLINEMERGGRRQADIVSELAYQLPLKVITHLYGVPESDQEQVRAWCADWMRFISSRLSSEEQVAAAQGMESFFFYLADLIRDRREHLREHDLVSLFIQHVEPGYEPLSEAELVNNLGSVLLAGHNAVMNFIGNGVRLLMEHREFWDDIIAHPENIPATVEEILRFDPPTQTFFRTTSQDTTLGGIDLPRDSLLMMTYGSANRDETKFDEPDVFNPRARRDSKIMSFGHGPHYCLGAHLARSEGTIVFERLSQRLPGLHLLPQDYTYLDLVRQHGLKKLLVRW